MNDSRVEWLRRRVTKSLEISNKMFDDMVAGKTYVDIATVGTPFGPQYPDVSFSLIDTYAIQNYFLYH